MGSTPSKESCEDAKAARLQNMEAAILDFARKFAKVEPRGFVMLDVFHGAAMDHILNVQGVSHERQVPPTFTADVLCKHVDGVFVAGIQRCSVLVGITLEQWPTIRNSTAKKTYM